MTMFLMNVLFSDSFRSSLKKFAAIKKSIQKKVDMIIEEPIALGEPLKDNLRGFYSCSVCKNFITIFFIAIVVERKAMTKLYGVMIVKTARIKPSNLLTLAPGLVLKNIAAGLFISNQTQYH